MRTNALFSFAAGLTLPVFAFTSACSSSSTSATPDSGSTEDASHPRDATGDTKSTHDAAPDGKPLVDAGPQKTGPCAGVTGTCVAILSGESEADVHAAFTAATAGTTLAFGPGTFSFSSPLTLSTTSSLTVKGTGYMTTTLDFAAEAAGADGIDAQGTDHLTLFGFSVEAAKADAIKVTNSSDVIVDGVKASWVQISGVANGSYGVYADTVTDLLIQNCLVTGATDAGIYVGQSQNAAVRGNNVYGNSAGIEIANTFGAVLSTNNSHDNAAGVLVVDLPNLTQQGGHDVLVYDNQILNNYTANTAPTTDIVSQAAPGTGLWIMAGHGVEAYGNNITNSETTGIAVTSYLVTKIPVTDASYYPYPRNIYVHDNTLSGSGTSPDQAMGSTGVDPNSQVGLLLYLYKSTFPGGLGPDLLTDGAVDPAVAADAGTNPNPMNLCFQNNGASATFVNLDIQKLVTYGGDGGTAAPPDGGPTNLPLIDSFAIAPFTCTGATAPAIDAGLTFPDAGL